MTLTQSLGQVYSSEAEDRAELEGGRPLGEGPRRALEGKALKDSRGPEMKAAPQGVPDRSQSCLPTLGSKPHCSCHSRQTQIAKGSTHQEEQHHGRLTHFQLSSELQVQAGMHS